eukprot:1123111-Amphidinium_carterae.1
MQHCTVPQEPHVTSAQASFRLGCTVDVLQFARSLPNTEVNMDKMPNKVKLLGFRSRPKFTVLSTGTENPHIHIDWDHVSLASTPLRVLLQRCGLAM